MLEKENQKNCPPTPIEEVGIEGIKRCSTVTKEIRANISRKKGRLNKKNCPPIAKEQQISWRIINYSPISKKRKVGTWQAFTLFFKIISFYLCAWTSGSWSYYLPIDLLYPFRRIHYLCRCYKGFQNYFK